jgi:hypothetical protein
MASVPGYSGEGAHLAYDSASDSDAGKRGRDDFNALKEAALARERARLRTRRGGPRQQRAAQRRLERLAVLPPRAGGGESLSDEEDAEEAEAIDLKRTTPAQRADIVSRALPSGADTERFFQRVRARLDRAGVRPASVEVRRYGGVHARAMRFYRQPLLSLFSLTHRPHLLLRCASST